MDAGKISVPSWGRRALIIVGEDWFGDFAFLGGFYVQQLHQTACAVGATTTMVLKTNPSRKRVDSCGERAPVSCGG